METKQTPAPMTTEDVKRAIYELDLQPSELFSLNEIFQDPLVAEQLQREKRLRDSETRAPEARPIASYRQLRNDMLFEPPPPLITPLFDLLMQKLGEKVFYRRVDLLSVFAVLLGMIGIVLADDEDIVINVTPLLILIPCGTILMTAYMHASRLLQKGMLMHLILTPISLSQLLEDMARFYQELGRKALTAVSILLAFSMLLVGPAAPLFITFLFSVLPPTRNLCLRGCSTIGLRFALDGSEIWIHLIKPILKPIVPLLGFAVPFLALMVYFVENEVRDSLFIFGTTFVVMFVCAWTVMRVAEGLKGKFAILSQESFERRVHEKIVALQP